MTAVDSVFPQEDITIDLPNFPFPYFVELDIDNKNKLIISSSFD